DHLGPVRLRDRRAARERGDPIHRVRLPDQRAARPMATQRRRLAGALIALAGCNQLFGLRTFDTRGGDAAPEDGPEDAPVDVIDAPPCVSPAIVDTFDIGPACTGWGTQVVVNGGA